MPIDASIAIQELIKIHRFKFLELFFLKTINPKSN